MTADAADTVDRAAHILRNAAPGPLTAIRTLHCLSFQDEALAEWLERHPGDSRALSAARGICAMEDAVLDAYLQHAEDAGS